MKRCNSCGQILSQKITTCPACGSHIMAGIEHVDDYQIKTIIHEGRSTMVCKAQQKGEDHPVSIRLFTEASGVDNRVAARLKKELLELQKLPSQHFVRHHDIRQSRDGLWYRVSEWVDARNWGAIFVSGILNNPRNVVTLFHNIASVLDLLHKRDHFMPYLILDDILIPREHQDQLQVKINYKLSRFLNARATHHGPMLQKLLDCHPDIINQRPIDFKSAIWSLGKVFVEILTANPNVADLTDNLNRLDHLPADLITLIKVMLSDDPDLRPQSMGTVVSALSRIKDEMPSEQTEVSGRSQKPKILGELSRLKKTVFFLIFLIAGMAVFGAVSWFQFTKKDPNAPEVLSGLIDSYTGSIAFLMVEYWIADDKEEVLYKNKVEGTAFLVDPEGYLLTNRHVACPWLEDTSLFQAYAQLSLLKKTMVFDYRMYLWFEGEKAFNRLPALSDSVDISDSYYLSSAYSTDGKGNLRIVGVPRTSVTTGDQIKSPFKNDFAVLKIDYPPARLRPLPLNPQFNSADIKRLSPVIILGFPLGNRTQYDHINTSITRGHVRRSTKEIIQVDSSIYKGNSGGPAINRKGEVIGIASGVVTDQGSGYFRMTTPLSDFGLVLPIARPSQLVAAIKSGQPHWDGFLDFTMDAKMEQITSLAIEEKFEEARQQTESMLKERIDPVLLFASGMLNFCTRQFEHSRFLFQKLSKIEPDNTTARLMVYIIDWIQGRQTASALTNPLFTMEWHEENEYLGYLARTLKQETRFSPQYHDFENLPEKSWRLFIEGLVAEKKNELGHAQAMFRASVLNANINDWVYFISLSRLNHIQENMAVYLEDKEKLRKEVSAFRKKALEYRELAEEKRKTLTELLQQLESQGIDNKKKVEVYHSLLELDPENRTITGRVAFFYAMDGNWQEALTYIDRYFQHPGRETSLSLSLGLLKGEILHFTGSRQESLDYLEQFSQSVNNHWYSTICRHLPLKNTGGELIKLAGSRPEKLLTLHAALGLWAEGGQDRDKAAHHYREALSSYLDDWNEYDLALSRILLLRQSAAN